MDNRTFFYKDVVKTKKLFKLLVNTDNAKKGKKFDCFNGLVSGVVLTINGKNEKISFTNKEYFQLVVKKSTEKALQCQFAD